MAEPSTSTTPSPPGAAIPVGPDALRIVLFGLPAAGKSSLLGALAQAAQMQEHALNGRLIDRSGGHLAELQHRLYEERSRPTAEEVAPYAVEFDPFIHDGQTQPKVEAVIIDCDGRVANDLLARRRALHDDTPEGTLAREVVEADTLVLVVDAAAPAVQVDAEFTEFGRFLRLLEVGRGRRSDVGGLPVFLVLTKCDLLAQPSDTAVDWLERIEERKRQVHRRFQDFLARQTKEEGPLPFGRIELHLWATSVKRPPLGPTPAKPREPYGVAELFRQCLEMAQQYRKRRRHSSHRLLWTVAGTAGLLTVMAGLTLGLYLGNRGQRPSVLTSKIEPYATLAHETPSVRLREPLDRKISELTEIENDPNFVKLPDEQQEVVRGLRAEMRAYESFRQEVQHVRSPASARSDSDLKEIDEALTTKLKVPEPYHIEPDGTGNDWSQTEAVHLLDQRRLDVKAFRTAVNQAEDWYHDRKMEADRLLRYQIEGASGGAALAWSRWYDQYKKLLEAAASPPFREEDAVPGSTTLKYGDVFHFNRVAEARSELDAVKQRLDRVRDMGAALGQIGPLADRPALLVIPKSPDFTAADARARLQALKNSYPRFSDEFLTADLPDAVASPLRKAARVNYEKLLDPGRNEVLKHLQAVSPDGKETVEHWREVRAWLTAPEELDSWRLLAKVLGRLNDPDWGDPVNALTAFLSRDRFDLDLKDLSLEIPYDLDVKPAGKLSIFHPATNNQGPALSFEIGSPQTDDQRRVRVYRLRSETGNAVLTYHPGEKLWATLPVERMNNSDWQFTWARGRSAVYQFDHLARAPQLHPKDQDNAKGEVAQGVALRVPPPGSGLPSVPDLMPVVTLEKR
jgi:hypothetical protein